MQLAIKRRPTTWAEVAGQDKAVGFFQRRDAAGTIGGNAYCLSGKSGTGKTTIALIAARCIADEWGIVEMDAQGLTANDVSEMERATQTYAMGSRPGHAIIVNECHRLTPSAIAQLLTTLERIPEHVAWFFTTTLEGMTQINDKMIDAEPFMSRCLPIELSQRGLCKPFAERAYTIAMDEGLTDRPLKDFETLAKKHRNNLRAMLSEIEVGSMIA